MNDTELTKKYNLRQCSMGRCCNAKRIEELHNEIELHKNLAIGYAQALKGEGVSSSDLKSKLKKTKKMTIKQHILTYIRRIYESKRSNL